MASERDARKIEKQYNFQTTTWKIEQRAQWCTGKAPQAHTRTSEKSVAHRDFVWFYFGRTERARPSYTRDAQLNCARFLLQLAHKWKLLHLLFSGHNGSAVTHCPCVRVCVCDCLLFSNLSADSICFSFERVCSAFARISHSIWSWPVRCTFPFRKPLLCVRLPRQ